MLTKDLLKYSVTRQRRIFPRFLDTHNKQLLAVAQELIDIYTTGNGLSMEELGEMTHPVVTAYRSPVVAKGLNKLLLNRCRFKESEEALPDLRMRVFSITNTLLKEPGFDQLSVFRDELAKRCDSDAETLSQQLYSDLPIRQPLISLKPIEAEMLLHRYNTAQVQGLLIRAASMDLEIDEPDVGLRREILRFLRFFRLLATIRKTGTSRVSITIDGPMSLLQNSQKYGFQMACFFPAVCALSNWQLTASIKISQRPARLELDHTTGLKTHFTRISGYRPDSFSHFADNFEQLDSPWRIRKNPPLLDLGQQEIIVPDFTFKHPDQGVVHLEMFHRWHAAALNRRLKTVSQNRKKKQIPLLIGVDRFLSKDKATKSVLDGSPWFQEHGVLFNDFPTVKSILKGLKSFL
ncbi:MAG: DUF790 family protein [Magnetococcales bacterium]|nr:DUF790 family protein [Magnetococcales bacterium]